MPLSTLSATEAAFLAVALLQAVASLVWGAASWVIADARRPCAHWAVWAVLSSATWFMLATHLASPPALAVLCGVLAVISLWRGVREYIGRPFPWWLPVALLLAALSAEWLAAAPPRRHWHAGVNFGVLALLYLRIGLDLLRHARADLHLRWPATLVLAFPALVGALAFGARASRALVVPQSVAEEMQTHSALNVGSAFSYLVLVLLMHSMLLALVAGRLAATLRRLSRRDGLTGLLNRRAIEEALSAQLLHSRRSAEPFAAMMLDVDHFKTINDRYGHAAGDQALKHVAARLRAELREIDHVGRYGGEEFLLVLPGLRLEQAMPVAERVRAALAEPALHTPGGAAIALSASIGVAEWMGGAESAEQLVARADEALFEAKAAGRNLVAATPRPAPQAALGKGVPAA